MLEEGRVLLGCRSELLQLRVHALLDFASGVEMAQEHRLTGAPRREIWWASPARSRGWCVTPKVLDNGDTRAGV